MSLTTCLNKAGPALQAADRGAIMARSASLRRAGLSADDAARQAIDERIGTLEAELRTATPSKMETSAQPASPAPGTDEPKGLLARRAKRI